MDIFKLSPENLQKWSITREKGKRRFQKFWTLCYGLTMFVFMSAWIHHDAFTSQFPFVDNITLIKLAMNLFVYLLCGYFIGSFLWNKTENAYQKQIGKKE